MFVFKKIKKKTSCRSFGKRVSIGYIILCFRLKYNIYYIKRNNCTQEGILCIIRAAKGAIKDVSSVNLPGSFHG